MCARSLSLSFSLLLGVLRFSRLRSLTHSLTLTLALTLTPTLFLLSAMGYVKVASSPTPGFRVAVIRKYVYIYVCVYVCVCRYLYKYARGLLTRTIAHVVAVRDDLPTYRAC